MILVHQHRLEEEEEEEVLRYLEKIKQGLLDLLDRVGSDSESK